MNDTKMQRWMGKLIYLVTLIVPVPALTSEALPNRTPHQRHHQVNIEINVD